VRPGLLAAILCLLPLPALARADDPYAQGAALRAAGHSEDALPLLEAASRLSPDDADVWLNLGLAYSAVGRFDDAQAALQTAARLSPDYPDVQVGLARLAYFRNDYAEADRLLARATAIQPGNADALALAAQVAAAREDERLRWRLDANVSHGSLSNGLPSAGGATIVLARRMSARLTLSGGVDHQRQFNAKDTYFEAVAAGPAGYVAVGATPDADFRPEVALRGGVLAGAQKLGGDWTFQLGADGGWARYPTGEVLTLSPAVTIARGEALSLTARWINVIDETDRHRSGYQIRGAWRAAPRLALSAGYADAPESSQGATTDVRALSLGIAYDIDDRTTVRVGGEHAERAAYDRDDLTVGLTRRF